MDILTPQQLLHKMKEAKMDEEIQFKGCTDQEIKKIEDAHRFKLPKAYKEYLVTFGKSKGDLFSEAIFLYPDIVDFYHLVPKEFGDKPLPPSCFVFIMRNETNLYFDTNEGSDPPVYRYIEEEGEIPEKVFDTFSGWLTDYTLGEIDGYISCKENNL